MTEYITLRMPVHRENGSAWHPKYDLVERGVPKNLYRRHYKMHWYKHGALRYVLEHLASKFICMEKPSRLKITADLVCKLPLPDGLLDSLLKTGEVSIIDTPEKFKF